MQAESSLWGRRRVVGSKLKHDGTLGYISRDAARRSGLNPAGWHRYVPIVVVAAIIVIALAALGYAGDGASLGAMFKSPELAHAGTELVEGAQDQTGVAPQRGMVAAAATIADTLKVFLLFALPMDALKFPNVPIATPPIFRTSGSCSYTFSKLSMVSCHFVAT